MTCERPRQHEQGFAKTFDLPLGLFKFWRLRKFPLTSPSGDSELMGPRNVEYIDRAARTERIGAQDKHRPVFQRFIQFLFDSRNSFQRLRSIQNALPLIRKPSKPLSSANCNFSCQPLVIFFESNSSPLRYQS